MIPHSLCWGAAPIYLLDTVDSSNNYAMQLIHADKAQDGTLIVAHTQTEGRGQRGRSWQDVPGDSLLMSTVCLSAKGMVTQPFVLSACAAVAVVSTLLAFMPTTNFRIKWPNDVFIGDKKTAGILIENTYRGSEWQHAVIGIGINMHQRTFPKHLPHATSLCLHTLQALPEPLTLAINIRTQIATLLNDSQGVLHRYNELLYKRGAVQQFSINDQQFSGMVQGVSPEGSLLVKRGDELQAYLHGQVEWVL